MKTFALQEQSASKLLFHAFFEGNALPAALVDAELKVLKANSLFCDRLGLPSKQDLTELPLERLPFASSEAFQQLLDNLMRQRLDRFEYELDLTSPFTEETAKIKLSFWAFWQANAFDGGFIALQDISHYHKKTQLLEERIKALRQENVQLKHAIEDAEGLEQFSLLAAHDLKGPIRILGNFSQLLMRRYYDVLDDEGRDYLKFIHDSAAHLNLVLTDMIHYADVARKPLHFDVFDFEQLVRQLKAKLAPLLKQHGAILEFDNPPRLLHGSRKYLRLLFLHLIENAIKFAKPGVPPHIRVTYHRTPEAHIFGVHDNGIGIKPDYHDKIFELFKRLDPASNRPGSGVGLAICKKIVERHGGRIWVESEEGKGASFYFSLQRI